MDPSYYRELIRPGVAGRRFVIAGAPLAAAAPVLATLRDLGAEPPFIIAAGTGTGTLPSEDEAEWVVLDVQATTMIEEIRLTRRLLHDLPTEILERIDAWDPDRGATVLGTPFYVWPELAGRAVHGYRRPEWEALEDKMLAEEIWDAADVARAPAEVIPVERDALLAASRRLDRSSGVVWAGDAREGFNGGAEYIRWIRHPADAAEALDFFADHCDRVRVTPFLEGIPCSIHGVVFPETTAVFRPCEMFTLRRPGNAKLAYSGSGTFWDPADADRESMRAAARRIGDHLRQRAEYRGAFTVDGVMSEEGFLPTELNPRPGAALGNIVGTVEAVPFGFVHRAVVEAEPLDYRPAELERILVESADATRRGWGIRVVDEVAGDTTTTPVVHGPDGYSRAEDGEEADGTLSFGPGAVGGFVSFRPEAARVAVGPSFAPQVAAALRLADELWNTGIGSLEPARPVR